MRHSVVSKCAAGIGSREEGCSDQPGRTHQEKCGANATPPALLYAEMEADREGHEQESEDGKVRGLNPAARSCGERAYRIPNEVVVGPKKALGEGSGGKDGWS